MVDEKEFEKRLEEAVKKKRPTPRVIGRAFLEELKRRISPNLLRTDTVTADVRDTTLVVEVRPKEGWEFRWMKDGPLVYTRTLRSLEVEAINKYPGGPRELRNLARAILKDVVDIVLTKYYGEYLKPMYIFNERMLASRVGGPTTARTLMANLAKMGSPWHASFLAYAIPDLVRKWRTVTDPKVRYYMIEGLSDIGFPTLEEILLAIDPMEIPYNEMLEFVSLVSEGVKDVLSQYARVYESPDHLTDEDIRKTLELCDELAKKSEREWFKPVTFDESPLLTILTRNRDLIPTIWERISPIIAEKSEEIKAEIEREKKAKEAFAEEVAKTVAEELRKKKVSEREFIDLIKEEILKRMGQI